MDTLHIGDLIFWSVDAPSGVTTSASSATTAAIQRSGGKCNVYHVSVITRLDPIWIVDATPKHGVVETVLMNRVAEKCATLNVDSHLTLTFASPNCSPDDKATAVAKAVQAVGCPYNHIFAER
jgi:hypothetical protein